MLAFALLASQTQTVTFVHECADAETVLVDLGQQLGLELKPTGSVKSDYFLVHVTDQSQEVLFKRIAETLEATWTEKDGVHYLGRTPAQEDKVAHYASEVLRQKIEANLETASRAKVWTRDDAKRFLLPLLGKNGTADPNKIDAALTEDGPYKELLHEFVRAVGAEKLSRLPSRKNQTYRWNPSGDERAIPRSFRTMAAKSVQSLQAFANAMRELGIDVPPGYDVASSGPDLWSFNVTPIGNVLSVSAISSRGNAFIFASLLISAKGPENPVFQIEGLDTKYAPSPLAKALQNSLRESDPTKGDWNSKSPTQDKTLIQWYEAGFSTDPLHLIAGEAIFQAAKAAKLDVVAVVPDRAVFIATMYELGGQELRSVINLTTGDSFTNYDAAARFLSIKHTTSLGASDRFGRSAAAEFSVAARKEGWHRLEALAALAGSCDSQYALMHALRLSEALQPVRAPVRMISAERFQLLRILHDLPSSVLREAKTGSTTMRFGDLGVGLRSRIDEVAQGGFIQLSEGRQSNGWPSDFTWMHPPFGSTTVSTDGAVVEFQFEGADLFTFNDGAGVLMQSLYSSDEAARTISRSRTGSSQTVPPGAIPMRIDYENIALVKAERFVVVLHQPGKEPVYLGLIVDSRGPGTRFVPIESFPGPEGDALREELKRIGG